MAPNLELLSPNYFSGTYGISVQFFLIGPFFLTGCVTNCDNYYAVSARHCFDTYKMKKSGSTTGLAKIGVRFGGLPNILTGLFDNQKNNLSKSKSCSSPNLFTSRPDREINDEHNRMFKRAKSAFEETRRIFQQNDEKSLSKPQKTEGKKAMKPHPTGHVSKHLK